jgi:hypothetical protein
MRILLFYWDGRVKIHGGQQKKKVRQTGRRRKIKEIKKLWIERLCVISIAIKNL